MIIDSHAHIFAPGVITQREEYLFDGQFSLLYSDQTARLYGHGELLRAMDEGGIDCSIVMGFPWEREKYCAEQNEYFSEAARLSRGKIIPFGSVPLEAAGSVAEWVSGFKKMGLAGIGEAGFYRDGLTEENADFLRELFEAARGAGLPVNLHLNEPVGHPYTGKYPPAFERLYPLLCEYPDVTIILSHWGGGLFFYELMPEVKEALSRCYYDTAASPYLYDDRVYETAERIIGPDRVLMGSDWPLIKPGRYQTSIKNNISNKKTREAILGGNSARLFKEYIEA